jgi:hypothetical protein
MSKAQKILQILGLQKRAFLRFERNVHAVGDAVLRQLRFLFWRSVWSVKLLSDLRKEPASVGA